MKTVLVFAGTTEGRELLEILDRTGISVHACVATEYGSQILKSTSNVTVHTGRLDEQQMRELYKETGCEIVVDATHPYAVVVTDTIRKSIEGTDICYLRLLRDNDAHYDSWESDAADNLANGISDGQHYYDDIQSCASDLSNYEGNILLTTGSKELAAFASNSDIRERLIVRVIPGMESLKLCYDAGLEGRQIIAMQGPFSQEMNEAVIREYSIKHLVTKESGVTGGVDSKLAAVKKAGIDVHIIKRPKLDKIDSCKKYTGVEEKKHSEDMYKPEGVSIQELLAKLEKLLGVVLNRGRLDIVLAGIGPGAAAMMTKEVQEAIEQADYIFGARRMLDAISGRAKKYPYYLKTDIIPALEKIEDEKYKDSKVVIVFSGDTGFYSGSKKLYEAIEEVKAATHADWSVKILAGISSVSVLAARFGLDWQDGNFISLHGISREEWIPKLIDSVKHYKKTFFITSGVEDIHTLADLLSDNEQNYSILIGYQMTYPEEKTLSLSPRECLELSEEGLYSGIIVARHTRPRSLVPHLEDDFFIRDKVPMTKEEVRKISICQMKIKEGDVVYDIGSGTGSIAVQTAILSPSLKVYALECNPEAVELIKRNANKADVYNLSVIETMAPEGMDELPSADVCFIGGSKGNLRAILDKLYQINPTMRVVMNAVSLEAICDMKRVVEELNICDLLIEQLAVSQVKTLGDYHMLSANNPVFIFSFQFCRD